MSTDGPDSLADIINSRAAKIRADRQEAQRLIERRTGAADDVAKIIRDALPASPVMFRYIRETSRLCVSYGCDDEPGRSFAIQIVASWSDEGHTLMVEQAAMVIDAYARAREQFGTLHREATTDDWYAALKPLVAAYNKKFYPS